MSVPSAVPPPVVPGLSGLRVLARGGYATVYRAIQVSVSREVAVKVENRALESERDQRRFLREARAAGRMSSHPHVVDLFDAGVTSDSHPYLIMELCNGTYAERMKSAPLGALEARDVGVKIADALADAHELGVLHRDVKPANILTTRFGEPALADFGLAVLAETRDQSVTLDVLTPAYAPPELFRQGRPSAAVDVYALCATLYAVIRGRPARWREDRNPTLVTLMDLFEEPIPDLPGIPTPLMDVLRAGMHNDPAARPSAARLRDALTALTLGPPRRSAPSLPALASPQPSAPATAPPSTTSSTTPPTARGRATPPRANRPPVLPADTPTVPQDGRPGQVLLAVVGGLVMLGLLLSGGIWYTATHGAPAPARTRAPSVTPVNGPCVIAALNPQARCPQQRECYDGLEMSGGTASAAVLPCDRVHTWETFALGTLPASATGVGHAAVKQIAEVRGLCTGINLATILLDTQDWAVDVLPPTPEEFARGERTFRCLAGRGPNALAGPTLP